MLQVLNFISEDNEALKQMGSNSNLCNSLIDAAISVLGAIEKQKVLEAGSVYSENTSHICSIISVLIDATELPFYSSLQTNENIGKQGGNIFINSDAHGITISQRCCPDYYSGYLTDTTPKASYLHYPACSTKL